MKTSEVLNQTADIKLIPLRLSEKMTVRANRYNDKDYYSMSLDISFVDTIMCE